MVPACPGEVRQCLWVTFHGPGLQTYLFLLDCGVQHEGPIRVQGTGDPTEQGPHRQSCVDQCHAGGVQATGQELGATGGVKKHFYCRAGQQGLPMPPSTLPALAVDFTNQSQAGSVAVVLSGSGIHLSVV